MKVIGFNKISLGVVCAMVISTLLLAWVDGYKHPYISTWINAMQSFFLTMGFYQSGMMLRSIAEDRKWFKKHDLVREHYFRQLEALAKYHRSVLDVINDPKIQYDVNLLREKLCESAHKFYEEIDWNLTRHEAEKPNDE